VDQDLCKHSQSGPQPRKNGANMDLEMLRHAALRATQQLKEMAEKCARYDQLIHDADRLKDGDRWRRSAIDLLFNSDRPTETPGETPASHDEQHQQHQQQQQQQQQQQTSVIRKREAKMKLATDPTINGFLIRSLTWLDKVKRTELLQFIAAQKD